MQNWTGLSKVVLTAILISLLVGCATAEKKSLEREVDRESPMLSEDAIARKGFHEFFFSPEISKEERQELLNLHLKIFTKSRAIRDKIGRYKAVLFREMVQDKLDRKKVALIRESIKELYLKRLDIMMGALEEANVILGRDRFKIEGLMGPFIDAPVVGH